MKKINIVYGLYIILIILLFLYSYTQVDLSLTLSRASVYQTVEKFFQYIGYFQRPLSTIFYITIILLLFIFYGLFLILSRRNVLSMKQLWIIIIAMTVMLTASYNAFSYDLFNYIFDAKIVTHYGQNPYIHKALDYPGDPMLSFMRWTHRTYPYGPFWLAITIPLSFIGFQFFLPTFFLFKILVSVCFIGSVYFLSKILSKIKPNEEIFGTVLFSLNPLVIIESLISSHNDIVMIFFSLCSVYLLINKKNIPSIILLIISIGIKFATVFLIPVYLFVFISEKRNQRVGWQKLFLISSALMMVALLAALVRPHLSSPLGVISSFQTDFQPWYLLFIIPFAALAGKKYYTVLPLILMSLWSLVLYAPYIYYGDYNPPVPTLFFWIIVCGTLLSAIFPLGYSIMKSMNQNS